MQTVEQEAALRTKQEQREYEREQVAAHYENNPEIFSLVLDSALTYSTGVYIKPDEALETAQQRKFAYIKRLLAIRPGEKVLDIGCGWGSNLIPSLLEEIVASVDGVRAGGVAAVGIQSAQRETEMVCIVAETRVAPSEYGALSHAIRAALKCHAVIADRVLLTPPKSLPRTTSGKIQRLAIARMLEKGESLAQAL